MSKQTWINIGLLSLISILTLYLTLLGPENETEKQTVSSLDKNAINRIEIIRRDLDDFVFEKKGQDWFMQAPLTIKTNIARINAMLRLLEAESYAQLEPTTNPLDLFQLDKPKIIMKLNDHEFLFGNTDAIDQRRYVFFNNKIHLTNDFLYQQLTTNAAFFADTRLLPENMEIESIQFPANKLNKLGDEWQLETLIDIKPTELKRIVNSWKQAVAISASFYAEPETDSNITISSSNGSKINFAIVKTEPHLVLGRKDIGIQYHMGSDEAEKLLLKQNTEDLHTPETVE